MEKIKLSEIVLIPDINSLKRVDMSDEEYFSSKYSDYVSNSRMKLINPEEGGSPQKYKNPPHFVSNSLSIGSVVHQIILQPESFDMAPKMGRPTAKLGNCVDEIIKLRKQGIGGYKAFEIASERADYYAGKLNSFRIRDIIKKGIKYYFNSKSYTGTGTILSDVDWDAADAAIKSIQANNEIMEKLHPSTLFGDAPESYMEDAMFIDFWVIYKGQATKLKYKMKIDNWTIDPENKKLTLNDLKTARDNPEYFATKNGHLTTFNYYRQGALYGDVLKLYCAKEYGFTERDWDFEVNFLVVRNNPPYNSKCCFMNHWYYEKGQKEYQRLFKMIGYYNLFGWDSEVEFED